MNDTTENADLMEEVRIASCRYVVDAVHPTCGSTFLYYCYSDASEGFYVALCDERSKNKKEPVKRKALQVVKRIDAIVIQKRVIRDQRCTFLDSAHSSRSASCATSLDAPHCTTIDAQLEEWWCNVVLALCAEATGEASGKTPSAMGASFTAECQRVLHAPDDVRRLYQWALCSGAALPIHLSLRQLEMTQSSSVDHSPNAEFDPQESFTAYCDPLVIAQPFKHHRHDAPTAMEDSVLHGAAPMTPQRENELHVADILSPMTPTDDAASIAAHPWQPRTSAVYAQRNVEKLRASGQVLRTPPPPPPPNATNKKQAVETNLEPRSVRRWDASYL